MAVLGPLHTFCERLLSAKSSHSAGSFDPFRSPVSAS
jgi:hypothetical protein